MNIKNVILLSFLLCLNVYSDGFFYIDKATNKVTVENVVNNSVLETLPVIGQTYTVNAQNYALKIGENSEANIFLSNDIYIKARENTHLSFDLFDQTIDNLNGLPTKIEYSTNECLISLIEGQLEVICLQKTNSNCITINTALTPVILSNGKFIINCDEKTTIVFVVEGNAKLLDKSSKKKEIIVNANNTVVVVKAPKFQGGGLATMAVKANIFSVKETAKAEIEPYFPELNSLEVDSKKVRFVVVDKKVIGVKID